MLPQRLTAPHVREDGLRERFVAVLGSTGSIGCHTLKVLARFPERFRVLALAAGRNLERLGQQIETFRPAWVCVEDPDHVGVLRQRFPGIQVLSGREGLVRLANLPELDVLVSAIPGTLPLQATLEALHQGCRVALANKETLVAAGGLIRKALASGTGQILPVDSEQSAIFQCLEGHPAHSVHRVVLTASGGPFRDPAVDLRRMTPAQALHHPTWKMGTKITIDSASLMNKGLELIETARLFPFLREEQIDVVVHPQSLVHSLVEFHDGSILAQLGPVNMEIPIQYALTWPERLDPPQRLDLTSCGPLNFLALDEERFPSVALARKALRGGDEGGAVFQAANEVAVEAFLEHRIPFTGIFGLVGKALETVNGTPVDGCDAVELIMARTRKLCREWIVEGKVNG